MPGCLKQGDGQSIDKDYNVDYASLVILGIKRIKKLYNDCLHCYFNHFTIICELIINTFPRSSMLDTYLFMPILFV